MQCDNCVYCFLINNDINDNNKKNNNTYTITTTTTTTTTNITTTTTIFITNANNNININNNNYKYFCIYKLLAPPKHGVRSQLVQNDNNNNNNNNCGIFVKYCMYKLSLCMNVLFLPWFIFAYSIFMN